MIDESFRGTGRTTRMLQSAIAHTETFPDDKIAVVAHNAAFARQLKGWFIVLGGSPERIKNVRFITKDDNRLGYKDVFIDHFVYQFK